ncbi:hypothetical protein ZWY2020_017131 [Hordeum vulgare]|nr:hypothetical protein ZWY2020_017131 [Hordeum vulgare]
MALPNVMLEETEELARFGIPAATDIRMPSGWRLSVDRVSVAPVPEAGTPLFARAVGLYRARLSREELRNPLRHRGLFTSCVFGDRGGSDRRASVLLGNGDRRTVAARAAAGGAGSNRAPEPEPEPALLAEYRQVAAQEGDPDHMPWLQEAIRASKMVVSPQLLQDYIHIACVAGHPKDPPDFPSYNVVVADSIALVVDVSTNSSNVDDEDGGEAFGFNEKDLGGVEDD